jgi:hypothetical protein
VPPGSPLTRAVHWLEGVAAQVVPAFRAVEANSGKILSEVEKIAAVVEAADPAIASQVKASLAVIEEAATVLAAL